MRHLLYALLLLALTFPAQAETKPLRIAHLSDTHVCHVQTNPPGRFVGDPLARDLVHSLELLHKAVDHINALRPDLAVITGDLADRGDDLSSLREVKAELDRLHCPYYPVAGDHDRPEVFQQVFPGKINYYVDVGGWRFVALGLRAGRIGSEALEWLKGVLQDSRDRRVAIITHRPLYCDPLTAQIAGAFYSVKLTPGDADETLRILRARPEVRVVLSGHAHVARREKLGQIEMLWAPALVGTPPCFGLVTLDGDNVQCSIVPVAREPTPDTGGAKRP